MKKIKMLALTLVCTMLFATSAWAHELWLETDGQGEVGEEHTVDVFWGHFPKNIDPDSAYFDAIAEGQIWLLTPRGEKVDLEMEKLDDRYRVVFTPDMGGDYQVIFYHDRGVLDFRHGEPQGIQNVATTAKAYVNVYGDEDVEAWDQLSGLPFEVRVLTDVGHLHAGEEVEAQLMYSGEPLSQVDIIIISPEEQVTEATTDQEGKFSFTCTMDGPWLIKAGYFDHSIDKVDGEEVLGARFTTTALINSNSYESQAIVADEQVEASDTAEVVGDAKSDEGSSTYLYIIAAVLLVGAGVMFVKSKK
ncbi:putative GH25 family protein [Desulfitispora alkaliphila]|uniref:DUF4198 domain-containing protein n=1 Tax=Desulfitispora alkaliphila TaxID=622674 RepID=UPI003D250B8F